MGNPVIVRSVREVKRLQRAAREATAALRELERAVDADVFGRLSIEPDSYSADDLDAFVRMAISEYPGRPIQVIIVAPTGQGGT